MNDLEGAGTLFMRLGRTLIGLAGCDHGAVTLDYVVITAGVCMLALAGSTGMFEPVTAALVDAGATMIDTLAFDRFPQIFGE
ncbi:MAG: hypothetical protein AAF763_06860 [Pseudomonadota bacterium]